MDNSVEQMFIYPGPSEERERERDSQCQLAPVLRVLWASVIQFLSKGKESAVRKITQHIPVRLGGCQWVGREFCGLLPQNLGGFAPTLRY